MGGIESTLTSALAPVPFLREGVGLAFDLIGQKRDEKDLRRQQDKELKALKRRQRASMRELQDQTALKRTEILLGAQEIERKRRQALRRAVARQRAQFGGRGIESRSGSSEAVLLGLFSESEAERSARERRDTLKLGELSQGLEKQRRSNLMQRSRLQEEQKIEALSLKADPWALVTKRIF